MLRMLPILNAVTKVHPKNLGEQATRDAVMNMLKTWNTPYLDAVLLHYLECHDHIADCKGKTNGDWKGAWRALEKLYEEKLVRAIGVSNLIGKEDVFAFYAHAKIKPHIVQNWMDPFRQWHDEYLYAIDGGAVYMAYSTLGEQWSSMEWVGKNLVMQSPTLNAMAAKRNVSVATIVLAWALHHPKLVIIPRSTNPAHIEENAQLLNPDYVAGILTEEEVARIDEMDGKFDLSDKATCAKMKASGGCNDENPEVEMCLATCQNVEW